MLIHIHLIFNEKINANPIHFHFDILRKLKGWIYALVYPLKSSYAIVQFLK